MTEIRKVAAAIGGVVLIVGMLSDAVATVMGLHHLSAPAVTLRS